MPLETATSLGVVTFDDGEWDQSRGDADTQTIIMWWKPLAASAHQSRVFTARSTSGSQQWGAEYRDSGAEVDELVVFRVRATTNMVVQSNDPYTVNEWNFSAWVDNGSGNTPSAYNGSLSSLATEAGSYDDQVAGSGTPVSAVSNNIPLNIFGRRPNTTGEAWIGEIAMFAMYDAALSLAQIQSIQFNSWAEYDNCYFLCFPGMYGSGTGQVDHAGGNTNSVVNGTLTQTFDSPAPVRFPIIGSDWQDQLVAAAATGSKSLTLLGVG